MKDKSRVSARTLLPLKRTIRDRICGTIHLTEEEIYILEHKLFRRLHSVKQNSFLYLVFPSAHHTRFEHSLGVLDNATHIFENLFFNSFTAVSKTNDAVNSVEKAKPKRAINFNNLGTEELSIALKFLRLAALGHDIGHGPFSHTFDSFAPTRETVIHFIKTHAELDPIKDIIPVLEKNEEERIEHEEMSCILFAVLWNDINEKESRKDVPINVASILFGKPEMCTVSELVPFIPLLHDIVASAPADADRMDYIERDSHSIGVSYGYYDKERVLKSFLPYKEQNNGKSFYRLGIKESGKRAIENFVQARFELFVQIYFHKTNRAIELMLKTIAKLAKENEIKLFEFKKLTQLVSTYESLSDEKFLNILRGKEKVMGKEIGNSKIIGIANDIYNRKLWKRIYEGEEDQANEVLNTLSNKYHKKRFKKDTVDPKAAKDLKEGAALLKRGEDGVYFASKKFNWFENSEMIQALANREEKIVRIYFTDNDSNVASDLRSLARKTI